MTAARQALIADLNAEAAAGWFDFPGVRLALDGTVEGVGPHLDERVLVLLEDDDDVQFAAGFDRASIMEQSKGKVIC